MTTKHTPRPFKVIIAEDFAKGMFQVVTDERCPLTIAFVCDDIPAGEANAALIAAAPDLLEALRPMVQGTAWITDEHIEAARAALAKATGGQP